MSKDIWIIGSGQMAQEYLRVVKGMMLKPTIIGRGKKNAADFEQATGVKVNTGGIDSFLQDKHKLPKAAIVAIDIDSLVDAALGLINYGVKIILIEKPGALDMAQLINLNAVAAKHKANVFIAYNRRFYSSVQKAMELIRDDGGVRSFNFEFTEWSHVIKKLKHNQSIKDAWFLANSTHVVDLAFFLGGRPSQINCLHSGSLSWHSSSSNFCGSGKTYDGALFSYNSDWNAPGRWSVEILTKNHRFYLSPLEHLKIMKKGTINISDVTIDDQLDVSYKPGLYRQLEALLSGDYTLLCTVDEQVRAWPIYKKMAGY